MPREAVQAVVARIHRPDNLIQRPRRGARGAEDQVQMPPGLRRFGIIGLRQFAQGGDLAEVRTQVIMQVLRNAGAVLLNRRFLLKPRQAQAQPPD
jgi:hypothetical protein